MKAAIAAMLLAGVLLAGCGGGAADPIRAPMPPATAKERAWLARSTPLGQGSPAWAERLYRRSLLVLRRMTSANGAMIAGDRDGWRYVWPRDAAAGALALEASGHTGDARRVWRFLRALDLREAARYEPDGEPVGGRSAAGDAAGWVGVPSGDWQNRQDYGENKTGDLLGNAIASGAPVTEFNSPRGLTREAGGDELDSAAAWAITPFHRADAEPAARRTLLNLTAESSRYGIPPMEGWTRGEAWTAPTAWSAWALASAGDRRQADTLLRELRRAATSGDLLPERVSIADGRPLSTTPLTWSHAFAALALLQRYPPKS